MDVERTGHPSNAIDTVVVKVVQELFTESTKSAFTKQYGKVACLFTLYAVHKKQLK